MKQITIHYLPHTRPHFCELMFYFLNKVKPENKEKLMLNIYTHDLNFFRQAVPQLLSGIECNIIHMSPAYMDKINVITTKLDTPYSVKLDEDIFISNHLWDYMIENVGLLDDDENLILAPLLSCGIPTGEYFIDGYFDADRKKELHDTFLRFGFGKDGVPVNPWGWDMTFINRLTTGAGSWDGAAWLEETNNIPHHYKGYHPLRNGYETHRKLNELILDDVGKLVTKNDYSVFPVKNRYYTNSMFFVKSETWLKILTDRSLYRDGFDEVPLNLYMQNNNLNYLFVKEGYAIHTMYNTNIKPGEDNEFYQQLKNRMMSV